MPNIPILARGCIFKTLVIPFSFANPLILLNIFCPFPNPKAPILAKGCIITVSVIPFSSMNPLILPKRPPAASIVALPSPFSLTDEPKDITPSLKEVPKEVAPLPKEVPKEAAPLSAIPVGVMPRRFNKGLPLVLDCFCCLC